MSAHVAFNGLQITPPYGFWSMKRSEIIRVGNAYLRQSQCGNVYSQDGISPAVNCGQKRYGGLSPFILIAYERG